MERMFISNFAMLKNFYENILRFKKMVIHLRYNI